MDGNFSGEDFLEELDCNGKDYIDGVGRSAI